MKKSLAILLAAVMVTGLASCGKKAEKNSDTSPASATEQAQTTGNADEAATEAVVGTAEHQDVDENGVLYGTELENAIEQVDMAKVDGESLKQGEPEDTSLSASGEISNFKVEIKAAKVIDYDGEKVVVITYDFRNGNSVPQSFDSMIATDVSQGGSELKGVSVIGVEGVNIASCLENIESGETKTVQKAFTLQNEDEPVQVIAYKYGEMNTAGMVGTSFNLK